MAVASILYLLYSLFVFETASDSILQFYPWDQFFYVWVLTMAINIVMHGRTFLLNWRQAAIDMEKLKTQQIASQYESLRNQVNPHFLFNSLNALSSLVYDEPKDAIRFIRKLSEVYRYVLDNKDEELVSLKEEMDFVGAYVFLHQIRFGTNLKLACKGEIAHAMVPPLAVQLLVENAIKHNVISQAKPLQIDILLTKGEVRVSNKVNKKNLLDSSGIGLKNLSERYSYLSKIPVVIEDKEDEFSVRLPLLELK